MITVPKIIAIGAGVLVLTGALAWGVQEWGKGKVDESEIAAALEKGRAIGFQDGANSADKVVAKLHAEADAQDKTVDRLVQERDAALRRLAAKRGASVPSVDTGAPSKPETSVVAPQDDPKDAVILADARLIEGQAKQIVTLKAEVTGLTSSRDQWKKAFEAEAKRADLLQISLDAQKTVSKSGLWLGRVQGLAVGLGAGYLAGKIR